LSEFLELLPDYIRNGLWWKWSAESPQPVNSHASKPYLCHISPGEEPIDYWPVSLRILMDWKTSR